MAATVQSTMLTYLRQHFIDMVDHAQYRINTYTTVPINEKRVNDDGTVTVGFYIPAQSGTVTSVRLLDKAGNALVAKAENIPLEGATSAVYYFFTYSIYELTE